MSSSYIAMPVVNHSLSLGFDKIKPFGKADVALIASGVALLAIGILASIGIFNFIGTTHATYLSYGAYGGVALLCMANCVYLNIKAHQARKEFNQQLQGSEKEQLIQIHIGKIKLDPAFQADPIKYLGDWGKRLRVGGGWYDYEINRLSPSERDRLSIEVYALSAFRAYPNALKIKFFKNHLLEEIKPFVDQCPIAQEDWSTVAAEHPDDFVKIVPKIRASIMRKILEISRSFWFRNDPIKYICELKQALMNVPVQTFTTDEGYDNILKKYALMFLEQYYQKNQMLYLHSQETM